MKKVIKIFLAIAILSLIFCSFSYNEVKVTREVIKASKDGMPPDHKTTINDYVVNDHFDGIYILDISKNNVPVFNISSQHRCCYDGRCIELLGEKGCLPAAGISLENDGVPNLVIGEWTGGAYCCSKYTILSLGKEFKIIDEIDNGETALLFKDLDNDGKIEFIGRDCCYEHNELFGFIGDKTAIEPVVIWKYSDGKYRICTSLMKKPPPTKKEMEAYALMYKDVFGATIATGAQGYMLTLLYTGNANLIGEFYDIYAENNKKFHEYFSNKKAFIDNFYSVVKQSPYWEDVRKFTKDNVENTSTTITAVSETTTAAADAGGMSLTSGEANQQHIRKSIGRNAEVEFKEEMKSGDPYINKIRENILKQSGLFLYEPDISINGKHALYMDWRNNPDGNNPVMLLNIETGKAKPLIIDGRQITSLQPSPFWSSDSKFVVFTTLKKPENVQNDYTSSELIVLENKNGDFVKKTLITCKNLGEEECIIKFAQISPDNKRVSFCDANLKLCVMDIDGKNIKCNIDKRENNYGNYRWIDNDKIEFYGSIENVYERMEMSVKLDWFNIPEKPKKYNENESKYCDRRSFINSEGIIAEYDLDGSGVTVLIKNPENVNDPQVIFYRGNNKYIKATADEKLNHDLNISCEQSKYFLIEKDGKRALVRATTLYRGDKEARGRSYTSGHSINIYSYTDKKLKLLNSYFSDQDENAVVFDDAFSNGQCEMQFNMSDDGSRLFIKCGGYSNVITPDGVMKNVDDEDEGLTPDVNPTPTIDLTPGYDAGHLFEQ